MFLSDWTEPKVTVHILPDEELKEANEITLVCLIVSTVQQKYDIAWSEHDGNNINNNVGGIDFPAQKTKKADEYMVTSVYQTTKDNWNKVKMFNCNVSPAGNKKVIKPCGVSTAKGNSLECDK